MSDDINYKNNPLHGLSLKNLLIEIVEHYGFEILHAYLNINCFKTNPSIESSVKFLKKTDWAREKVESFYLYQYKNLPRASDEQFALAPRDRIIPDGQVPGKPANLSIEDAEKLQEKRARKAAERKQSRGRQGGKSYGGRSGSRSENSRSENKSGSRPHGPSRPDREEGKPRREPSPFKADSNNSSEGGDPWSKWR